MNPQNVPVNVVSVVESVPNGIMAHGWFDALKERFSAYPAWAVEMTVFGIIGLFLGLFFKMFGKYFVAIAIAMVFLFVAFSHFNVLQIDVVHLKELFGLSAVQSISDLVTIGFEWAKAHLIGCASCVVGFFIGLKLA